MTWIEWTKWNYFSAVHHHVRPVGEGGDLQEQGAGPNKANVMGTGLGGKSTGVK
jgi:hypothetical protein